MLHETEMFVSTVSRRTLWVNYDSDIPTSLLQGIDDKHGNLVRLQVSDLKPNLLQRPDGIESGVPRQTE